MATLKGTNHKDWKRAYCAFGYFLLYHALGIFCYIMPGSL